VRTAFVDGWFSTIAAMPSTTTKFKHRFEQGHEADVEVRWSFVGSAVQWFGNVSHQAEPIGRIGGRIQLSVGTESKAPSAVLVDVRRELWLRSRELEGRIVAKAVPVPGPSSPSATATLDLELELEWATGRGEALWREFFGAPREQDEGATIL